MHIVSLVAELLAYPCGVFLARVLPIYTLDLGRFGKWCINPDHVSLCFFGFLELVLGRGFWEWPLYFSFQWVQFKEWSVEYYLSIFGYSYEIYLLSR